MPIELRMRLATLTKHRLALQTNLQLSPGAFHSNRVAIKIVSKGANLESDVNRLREACSRINSIHFWVTIQSSHGKVGFVSVQSLPRCLYATPVVSSWDTPPFYRFQICDQGLSTEQYVIFWATGRHVYVGCLPASAADAKGERGKGGVYLPYPKIQDPISFVLLPELSLQSEIQSIKFVSRSEAHEDAGVSESTLAIVDSFGRAVRARLSFTMQDGNLQTLAQDDSSSYSNDPQSSFGGRGDGRSTKAKSSSLPFRIASLEPLQPDELLVDGGWAGIAISVGDSSYSAIARHFAKDITLFDGPLAFRTIHTTYTPYSVELLSSSMTRASSNGPVVVVAEGPTVSVWDVRVAGRGARIARMMSSPHAGHLYCTAVSPNSSHALLGAAGEDRTVSVWDPRRWRLLAVWNNCTKYEATFLHFPSSNPGYCVVGGLDYEVVIGRWGGSKRSRLGGGTRTGSLFGDEASSHASADTDSNNSRTVSQNSGFSNSKANIPLRDREGMEDGMDDLYGSISFRGDSGWEGISMGFERDVIAGITNTSQLYLGRLT